MTTLSNRMIPTANGRRVFGFDEFREAVSSSFVPLAVSASETAPFHGEINAKDAGHLSFVEITANAHSVNRTPELISAGGTGHYKLSIMLSGQGLLIQDHREMSLHPGKVAIYDTAKPYTLIFDGDIRNFVIMVPKGLINLPEEAVGELSASTDLGDSHLGRTVSEFLLHAPRSLQLSEPSVEQRVSRGAIGLLEALLLTKLGLKGISQDPRQVLLRKVKDFIEDHLGSADLSLSDISAAHYISTRHLHGLFQDLGMTASTYIRTRRLERCREELLDPIFATQQISTIAKRWGISDPTHFSRAFRAHFGQSPREIRAQSAQ